MSNTATTASTAHKDVAAGHKACAEHHLKAAQCHDAAKPDEAHVNATHAMECCETAGKNTVPGSVVGLSAEALISLRTDMLRFARRRTRNLDSAEDLVQETIEAALRDASRFAGRSTMKTLVFTTLRNRIIDHLRTAKRTVAMSSLVDDDEDWQERLETLLMRREGGETQRGQLLGRTRRRPCRRGSSGTLSGPASITYLPKPRRYS